MINKYWNNQKKVEWLNENFQSVSDRKWGRIWFYHPEEGPPYRKRVAYLPDETQGPSDLEVYYDRIEKYFKEVN